MNTRKSIILAAIGAAAFLYLGHLYSKLPLEVMHKIYEITQIVFLALVLFILLFLMLNGSKKSTPPTDDNDKNFTDINN